MTLTAILTQDPEGGFVALNPESGTTTEGETIAEVLANLKEATELYLEEFPLAFAAHALLTTFEVSGARTAAD
jgi:predicted RNase H-like HicB family nuclease